MDELSWLLDGEDPAVTAAALVQLAGRALDDPDVLAARRASLARGSVARVLEGLDPARDLWSPKYGAAYHRLVALAEVGPPADEPRIQATLAACLDAFAKSDGAFGHRDVSHLCVAANLSRAALAFGRGGDPRVRGALAWLVAKQRPDGGWHCFPEDEPGGILDSWEPLAAFAQIPPRERSADVRASIARGVEFLLAQRLGVGAGYGPWESIHFPRHYYYDFLLGLELITALSPAALRDQRARPALDLLRDKRRPDGRWALDATHPDVDPEGDPPYKPIWASFLASVVRVEVEPPGAPSRWATLGGLRVLRAQTSVV